MTSARVPQADASRPESGESARHIASTAARLFAERGYDATSVREIVEAAGVTKPTLYYHFGSKEGLAQALLTDPLKELAETMRRIEQDSEDPLVALEGVLDAQLGFCRDDPDRARFLFALLFGPVVSGLAGELAPYKQCSNDCMDGISGRLAEAGIVTASKVDAFVLACRGVVLASMLSYLYHGQDLGPDLPGRLIEDLLRGFADRLGPETGPSQ
jgi:AcrR family transcriptional regulator